MCLLLDVIFDVLAPRACSRVSFTVAFCREDTSGSGHWLYHTTGVTSRLPGLADGPVVGFKDWMDRLLKCVRYNRLAEVRTLVEAGAPAGGPGSWQPAAVTEQQQGSRGLTGGPPSWVQKRR